MKLTILLRLVLWIISDEHMRIAGFTGSQPTLMSFETEQYTTAAKYGVCQGRAKQDSCSCSSSTNGVLTQKEDKSALHAAVKRPCYTFAAETFNETDQYRKSINSAWWNIFIRQNTELVCFVKREIRRTHVSLLEKIMKTNNRLQLHSHPFLSALYLYIVCFMKCSWWSVKDNLLGVNTGNYGVFLKKTAFPPSPEDTKSTVCKAPVTYICVSIDLTLYYTCE